jgi:hypothetical protein
LRVLRLVPGSAGSTTAYDAARGVTETWARNEAELQSLADLPAGDADPAERERRLEEAQDRIEHDVGEEWMLRQREQRE